MARIHVVIADKDEEYSGSLVDFLLSHYSSRFEVTSFNEDSFLRDYLEKKKESVDLLLLGPGFTLEKRDWDGAGVVVFLAGEEPLPENEKETIFKYQCGERLVNQIMDIYARKNSKFSFPPGGSKKTRVVAFYSAAGGTGKTTLAVGSSLHSAWEGKSVFYLNLEMTPSTELFFSGEQGCSLSNVLFFLRKGGGDLAHKVDGARCEDCFHNGIYFFKPHASALDLKENLASELRLLVNILGLTRRYDRIFVDMSACLDSNNLAVLEACDEIMMVVTGDVVQAKKTNALLKELQSIENSKGAGLLGKIKYVVNMCETRNPPEARPPGFAGQDVYCEVPRVGSLVIPRHGKYGLDLNSCFGEAIYRLNAGFSQNDGGRW
ncbi:MAG: hypothetical protein QHH10_07215 [Peptococcaceae bacterium]|nr:hypothetical protein [Peptococcaceae bacterium]MDH7525090.1 hypothetical protein [Peptococcaceae bacterium]